MRVSGRRLPWREVVNGPVFDGDLVTFELQVRGRWVRAATLSGRDPAAPKQLPDLYEPVLLGIATAAFQLRGFERQDGPEGPFAVVQEWHCQLP